MRTIQITTKLKNALDEYSEMDESYDTLINRLLDEVEDDMMTRIEIRGYSNIGVSDSTLIRLRALKLSDKDSYTKVLTDAISYLK